MDTRNGVTHQVFSQPIGRGLGITPAIGTGASDQAEYPDVEDTPRSKGRWESQRIGRRGVGTQEDSGAGWVSVL